MTSRTAPETIEFPIVILGSAVLASLRVERMGMLDGDSRFASGHDRVEALDVLVDARAHEAENSRLSGVFIRFLRKDFSGLSYGLALALADKRARFPTGEALRVIATGEIVNGGDGRIGPIEGFEAKAGAVLDASAAAPVVFAFPRENWRQAAPETREALEAAQAAGTIDLHPADDLSELAALWSAPEIIARPVARRRPPWPALAMTAGGVLIAVVVAAGMWLQGRPLADCEGALSSVEAATPQTRAALVAAAVERCGAAAKARPGDGRILFLAGQAHAVNGGERLAEKYWELSAKAGDRDGLATWGRQRWLSAPEDRVVVAEALAYLGRAADMGSAVAMEDMAEIYTDGRATGVNVRRAEGLLAGARAIREKQGS